MDLKTALNQFTIDKDHVYQGWIQWATEDGNKFSEVMERAFNGSEKERKRANWILHHVSDRRPEVFYVKEKMMIEQLQHTITDAEVRLYFAIIRNTDCLGTRSGRQIIGLLLQSADDTQRGCGTAGVQHEHHS